MVDAEKVQAIVREWIDHELSGEPPELSSSRRTYAEHHLARCLRLIELIPNPRERGRLLELGSGIYLMTFLMRRLLNFEIDLVQYLGVPNGEYESVFVDRTGKTRLVLPFRHFNAETDAFPYADESFDVVLNSEMMEHLLCDPIHVLDESRRILKPGGLVVLSTPNAIEASNVLDLLQGRNIYSKYCRETPYGRHPREYTPEEIRRLFEETGFRVIHIETADESPPGHISLQRTLGRVMVGAFDVLSKITGGKDRIPKSRRGGHIFLVAEKTGAAPKGSNFLFEADGLVTSIVDAICRPRAAAGA